MSLRRRFLLHPLLLAASACTSNSEEPTARRELGMNDVTMLIPLPSDPVTPRLLPIEGLPGAGGATVPLVPRALYDSLVATPADIAPKTCGPIAYEQFHVVAVRFDLCDRQSHAPCSDTSDGVVRLVLQPTYPAVADGGTELRAHDVALHAFYPPTRRLSRMRRPPGHAQPAVPTQPLRPAPGPRHPCR